MIRNDIVVFDPKVAKDLLNKGYNIVNIAPDKKVENGTVFYFKDTDSIREYLIKVWDYNLI